MIPGYCQQARYRMRNPLPPRLEWKGRPFAFLSNMEALIPPVLTGDELSVIPALDDPAIIDDEDAVRIGDGGETVSDDQRGAAGRKLSQRLLDRPLRLGIQRRGRLGRMRVGGFFRKMRAMASRCFWPPESFTPRSPMTVSRLPARLAMTLSRRAHFAAPTISVSVASGRP